ncbi:hypothetical protein EfmAA242_28520 [Enterococcus faecium]|nr:hypothetical protein EfmAA242_28520 [Enterococcus faecium]
MYDSSLTGNREPISGGVRIAEVTNPGEANVRNKISVFRNPFKQERRRRKNLKMNRSCSLREGQSYFIEYALEVTDVDLFNEEVIIINNR